MELTRYEGKTSDSRVLRTIAGSWYDMYACVADAHWNALIPARTSPTQLELRDAFDREAGLVALIGTVEEISAFYSNLLLCFGKYTRCT